MSKKIFLSHISEEVKLAKVLKLNLELALDDLEVFVSAVDIHLGKAWLKAIEEALSSADAVMVLCSNNSVRRPWLNFESGGGGARGLPVIPICHGGLKKDDLPYPLSIYQGIELKNDISCQEIVNQISTLLKINLKKDINYKNMFDMLKFKLPVRDQEIGIVLSHGQSGWDGLGKSVFEFPDSMPKNLNVNLKIQQIIEKKDLLSAELNRFSGLIIGMCRKKHFEDETISAIYNWVINGGRLLLLGYEYGDRHHDANLENLSRHFGIHPGADIVGPPNFGRKPYGLTVNFEVKNGNEHPFTTGLSKIELTNVQTIRVEPGGTEWLRVGNNSVYQPAKLTVTYRDGILTQPGNNDVEENKRADWLPVAIQAPPSLCGDGAVNAIGTWQILGPQKTLDDDNVKMLSRILLWLSGQN